MNRRVLHFGLLVLSASLAGCAMCQSPFDYCGAVVGEDEQMNCDFLARYGSAFHPPADSPTPSTTPLNPKPKQFHDDLNAGVPDVFPEGETAEREMPQDDEPNVTILR